MFTAAKKTAFIVAAALSAAAAGSASAEQMTMTFTGLGPSHIVGVNYNTGRSYAAGPVSGYSYYYAGLMKWNTAWGERTTYCTQINEHVWNGLTVTYDVVDVSQVPDNNPAPGPMGAIKAELVRELYSRFYDTVRGSNDATLNAAFQLAIWEITHENLAAANTALAAGQLNLGLGAVQADANKNGAVVATAGSMLGMLGGASDNNWNDGRLFGLSHSTAQDQLLIVPIPAVLGVAAAGLLGVMGLRRRLAK